MNNMSETTNKQFRRKKILFIFKKELREIVKNRQIIVTSVIMPVVFAVLIPASMIALNFTEESEISETEQIPDIFKNIDPYWEESNELQKISILQANMYLSFLIMIPMYVPMPIAADCIAGEKERRTIEGLLAAPISEQELFFGKALAASTPSIIISWLAEIIYIVFTDIILYGVLDGRILLPNLFAILMFVLLMPTQTILSTLIVSAISSRSKGTREALQKSGLLTIPIISLGSAIVFVPFFFHPLLCLVSELILLFLVAMVLRLAVKSFNREKLLSIGS
ncbi:MAG: ABC transporter permease subunit [Candidatus Heimdallarchaeota archaeon]|nr:ABC transporter permease subunit [Candidatus Heimdallarchaeota archaeon]